VCLEYKCIVSKFIIMCKCNFVMPSPYYEYMVKIYIVSVLISCDSLVENILCMQVPRYENKVISYDWTKT
jgi:hypothetical protein